jgi:uncharacterized protein YlzI (FlbEa/FlbD family)
VFSIATEEVLISVHPQYGYGHGEGRDEIVNRVEEFDGHKILLKDEDEGDVYGDEEVYDLVIQDDQYGNLDDELSSVIGQVYEDIEIIGMYGSECVANAAESIGIDEITINPDATVDQTFGNGNYIVSDVLESGDPEDIGKYVNKFMNEDTAGRVELEDGLLKDHNYSTQVSDIDDDFEVADEDEGVEIIT